MTDSGLYIREIIEILSKQEFQEFGDFSRQFKIGHRALDGIGVNYSKHSLKSIKGYIKVLAPHPKFSDVFLKWTGNAKSELFKLCDEAPITLNQREDGLAGVNVALKYNCKTKAFNKSFYIKTKPNLVKVLNIDDKQNISFNYYRYINNKFLIYLLNNLFFLKMPILPDCMEFSFKKGVANATIYPQFKDPELRDRIGCEENFNNLLSKKPWNIEPEIEALPVNLKRKVSPITRGYTSFDLSRKIYFGLFSKKLSCFDL